MKQNTKELLSYGTLIGVLVSAVSSLILYLYQLDPNAQPIGDFGLGPAIPHILMALISFGLSYGFIAFLQEGSPEIKELKK